MCPDDPMDAPGALKGAGEGVAGVALGDIPAIRKAFERHKAALTTMNAGGGIDDIIETFTASHALARSILSILEPANVPPPMPANINPAEMQALSTRALARVMAVLADLDHPP